jgi:DNA repair exonuclease SbcCD ATPase subunit
MPITENMERLRNKIAELAAAQLRATHAYEATAATLAAARAEAVATATAHDTAQAVGRAIQQQAHTRIARLVSRCLAAVFEEDPYEFGITFEQKAGRTHATLAFTRGGHTVDPTTAAGGGAVDVAAFALRTAALMLARPPRRRLLLLDEPFRFVSAEYRPAVRVMLESLAAELGIQIIMVTHIEALRTGTIVEVQ